MAKPDAIVILPNVVYVYPNVTDDTVANQTIPAPIEPDAQPASAVQPLPVEVKTPPSE